MSRVLRLFSTVHRLNTAQYDSSTEVCKARSFLADDVGWMRALVDAFRSSFVPLIHVFAAILGNREPSSLRSFWKEHHGMFNTHISNRFRRQWDLLRNNSETPAYALLEVKKYLSGMDPAPFSASDSLQCVRGWLHWGLTWSKTPSWNPLAAKYIAQSHHSTGGNKTSLTRLLELFSTDSRLPTILTPSIQQLPSLISLNPQCTTLFYRPSSLQFHSLSLSNSLRSQFFISSSPVPLIHSKWKRQDACLECYPKLSKDP